MTDVDYSWEKYDLEAAAAERAGRIKKVLDDVVCGLNKYGEDDQTVYELNGTYYVPKNEEKIKKSLQDAMDKAIEIGNTKHHIKGETDYHAKQDKGKAKLSLVPRRIIWDVATIREYGNNKYPDGGPDNWRGVEPERYRDAAYRHFLMYLDDPHGVDDESGLPHLWHLACNIAFLCEMEDLYFGYGTEVERSE